jgi:membrane protease YdiL (CAAX protease family)
VGLGVALTWVAAVLLTAAARRFHRFERSAVVFARPRREALVALAAVLAQIVIVALLFAIRTSTPAAAPIESLPRYDAARLFVQLGIAAAAISPILAMLVLRRQGPTTVGLSRRHVVAQLLLGLAIGVVAVFAVGKAGALGAVAGPETLRLVAFLVVGFEEEIVFRGFLQTRLVGWLGDPRGWLLASATFAFAHLPQDLASDGPTPILLLDLALQLVFGLVFGWVALRVGGVWATGIAHGLADWVGWL